MMIYIINGLKMPLLDYDLWKINNESVDKLFSQQKEYKEKTSFKEMIENINTV